MRRDCNRPFRAIVEYFTPAAVSVSAGDNTCKELGLWYGSYYLDNHNHIFVAVKVFWLYFFWEREMVPGAVK